MKKKLALVSVFAVLCACVFAACGGTDAVLEKIVSDFGGAGYTATLRSGSDKEVYQFPGVAFDGKIVGKGAFEGATAVKGTVTVTVIRFDAKTKSAWEADEKAYKDEFKKTYKEEHGKNPKNDEIPAYRAYSETEFIDDYVAIISAGVTAVNGQLQKQGLYLCIAINSDNTATGIAEAVQLFKACF